MKIEEYDLPDDLFYHKEHCYAKQDGDVIVVGISDFAQQMAGTIKRVETLEEDDEVSQDKPFGTMSSGKWTGKLYSPVSGEIVEVNEDLEDEPSTINESPYGDGWIIKIKPEDPGELEQLHKGGTDAFAAWMKEEIKEKKAQLEG
jgi:glycine cleavage system H protein